jgi:hypothetical protein
VAAQRREELGILKQWKLSMEVCAVCGKLSISLKHLITNIHVKIDKHDSFLNSCIYLFIYLFVVNVML